VKTVIKLILGVLVLIVLTIFVSRILKIGDITCSSQFGPCNVTIFAKLENLEGLPFHQAKVGISEILAHEVLVKDFSIQFYLPNRLSVNLIERKPQFAVVRSDTKALALVDAEGYIVSIEEASNLPQIVIPEGIGSVGEKVSQENFFALLILADLFSFYQVKVGVVENGALYIFLNDGTKVIFPLEGDREILISSLALVLKRYEGVDVKPREIDLRFKNPVLRE